MNEVVELTAALCRYPSITPKDLGCQDFIAQRLAESGFRRESMRFGEVDNLWATHGDSGPILAFLGHTDVVPTGPLHEWSSPPFEPTIKDGLLYARGAADMKGSIAAMMVAMRLFVAKFPHHAGTLALLLTSDEEGEAKNGIKRVAESFQQNGTFIDWCVVGEPSSKTLLGDTIRIGRRGSLHGHLTVRGVQGHVAYPDLALNPIHEAAPALAQLAEHQWPQANEYFPATSFQISNIHGGTGATNVIPGELKLDFNFRFGENANTEELVQVVESILARHELDYRLDWELSGAPFLTKPGPLSESVKAAIFDNLGIEPQANTEGGTSDGRFIAPMGTQVVELGPINKSIHKIDEHVAIDDLRKLVPVYFDIMRRLLAA